MINQKEVDTEFWRMVDHLDPDCFLPEAASCDPRLARLARIMTGDRLKEQAVFQVDNADVILEDIRKTYTLSVDQVNEALELAEQKASELNRASAQPISDDALAHALAHPIVMNTLSAIPFIEDHTLYLADSAYELCLEIPDLSIEGATAVLWMYGAIEYMNGGE